MKNQSKLLLLLALLTFSADSFAQRLDSIQRLNEVSIRAARKIKTDSVSNALKHSGRLLELPQNIISINNNLLQLQGGFQTQDMLRNVSGLYNAGSAASNVFSGMGNVSIRGFEGVNFYRNGMPSGGFAAAALSQEDISLIEQIEVVKGPAGFLASAGTPGGSISVNTKAPKAYDIVDFSATAGSFNFYRANIDLGSAIKEKGFSYRFNAAYETKEYYFDYTQRNKLVIAPVLQYNFSKKTSALVEYNMTQGRAENGSQFGKFGDEMTIQTEPWSSNYMADPGLPVSKLDDHYGRLLVVHEINNNWKLTSQSSVKKTPLDQWTFYNGTGFNAVNFDATGNTTRRSFDYNRSVLSKASQLFLNGKIDLSKNVSYKLLSGVDWALTTSDTYQSVGINKFPFSRSNPAYGIDRAKLTEGQAIPFTYYAKNMSIGTYLYNNFSFSDKLFVNFGARYTWNDLTSHNYLKPVDITYGYHSFNPRVGASYLLQKDFSVYVNYDQSFEPQTGYDQAGNLYKPLLSYNNELGLKKDWFDGVLSTSISGFIIKRNNMLLYDPIALAVRQVGQVRSQGIDFDVIGQLSKDLIISANYSLLSMITSKDEFAPTNVGARYGNSPRHQINVWAMYSFPEGSLNGFSAGIGETSAIDRATAVRGYSLPNYIKLDATLMYQKNRWFIRGFLDNLTNVRYLETASVSNRRVGANVVGRNYAYQENLPLNFKIQVGMKFK